MEWAGDFGPDGYDYDGFLQDTAAIELNDRIPPTYQNCCYATAPDRMPVVVGPSWTPDAVLYGLDVADVR